MEWNHFGLVVTLTNRLPAPPILSTDRHCARYKLGLICIVLKICTKNDFTFLFPVTLAFDL